MGYSRGMSLERRLIASLFGVLFASLCVGATFTYAHAVAKVRTELQSALNVGLKIAQDAVEHGDKQIDPWLRLKQVVNDFDGDRHLRCSLERPDGRVALASTLAPSVHPAPAIFLNLVSGRPLQTTIVLPAPLSSIGRLMIATNATNEVAEAWSDLGLTLLVMGVFLSLALGLTVSTLRKSLQPIRKLCVSLSDIGAGDFSARLERPDYPELAPVQLGFNAMAARLEHVEIQNRVLATRLQCLQEDERAELARDLHDDVAPFLFAVSADAALIRQFARAGTLEGIEMSAATILDSASHMQKHLRNVLSRLMPDVLLDLGLPGAVDALVHFWKARKPEVDFQAEVTHESLDDRVAAVTFRVVQESLSNSLRHAEPAMVTVIVKHTPSGVNIEITDDGKGLPDKMPPSGLGLLGMRERVRSIGGMFEVGNRNGHAGVSVRAFLHHDLNLSSAV